MAAAEPNRVTALQSQLAKTRADIVQTNAAIEQNNILRTLTNNADQRTVIDASNANLRALLPAYDDSIDKINVELTKAKNLDKALINNHLYAL